MEYFIAFKKNHRRNLFSIDSENPIMETANTKIGDTDEHINSVNNNIYDDITPGAKINKSQPQGNVSSEKKINVYTNNRHSSHRRKFWLF